MQHRCKNQLVIILSFCIVFLFSCGGKNTESNVTAPGEEKTGKTEALEKSANIIQDKTPLKKISMYLNGFHFYNGDINAQMEAHHYCTKVNEDITQCVIFDGNGDDAKIMGVEYIISRKLFTTLPEEEKKLWHSHVYEVKSGELIAPGVPQLAEHELMEQIVSTYGKTFHTWHTDKELTLPVGVPQIMMGFTKDGQLADSLIKGRDKRFKISTAEKRENRKDIKEPPIEKGANAWEAGEVRQITVTSEPVKHSHK